MIKYSWKSYKQPIFEVFSNIEWNDSVKKLIFTCKCVYFDSTSSVYQMMFD